MVPAGDAGWLIELPDRLDADVNARAIDLAAQVEAAHLPGVTDIVVAYRTLMVYVEPLADRAEEIQPRLEAIANQPAGPGETRGSSLEVPVCYDGTFGPDLPDVAAFAGCSVDDVIQRHLSLEYRVFVVGFVPGFAYMAAVDPRIAAPRRPIPRMKVPAGSVAVAAGQTGIYPAETPGGWHLIGRSPVKPYDPGRAEPFLFKPGDRVRFRRITEAEFQRTTQWSDA